MTTLQERFKVPEMLRRLLRDAPKVISDPTHHDDIADVCVRAADALDAAEARATLAENAAQSDRETSMRWQQRAEQAERELAEARAREQRLREQLLLVLDAVLACETRHDERGHAYLAVPARSLHDLAAEMAALREAIRPTGGEPGGGEQG